MDGSSCYDALILSRSRKPEFSGSVEEETATAQGNNPVCGDRVTLSLRTTDGAIDAVRHHTRGCAICMASADLMAETVTGRSIADALELGRRFADMLETPSSQDLIADGDVLSVGLQAFRPLRTHRSRLRCATLPWIALGEALTQ
ncbi:MAG: Fe-S cluster assembly sulfur transfer protein SufU [Acetobacter aceti]|uniref:Iron-sulfur cluster assembly scaffold protein n=1 Tax=Acetobacter aceti TaxID=435 RepID=A0A1U9KD85_ACEAC|nr:SUF system NifU family Fe-S cluster assembly protein [Acetobacter aceti]AQS83761.1 iron-sulfur cluster assembly scaffold protein [Acetobacter aceti]